MRFSLAVERLKDDPHVDPARISAIGYCCGGEVILEMARAGAELDAVVTFAGILSTSNPAPKGYVHPRVLVLHGDRDPFAPREQVEAFRREMTEGAPSRLLKNSAKWDRQINPVVLRCSQH